MTDLSGYVGSFTATVKHRARYINADLCTGCGICQEKCPVKVIDEIYEAGIGYRKSAYMPFPQAVPKVPVIDGPSCTFFDRGTCKACEKFCPTGAIDFTQKDEEVQVEVGNVVLATGFELFDPRRIEQYGYGTPAERLHQPRVRADVQRRRPHQRPDRPARRRHRAEGGGDRPLRRQPRPQLQQLLLGDLLHAEPEVRPPRRRAHRRHGLQLLHRHPGARQGLRRVLPAGPGRGHDLRPGPGGRGDRRPAAARRGGPGRAPRSSRWRTRSPASSAGSRSTW